MPAEDANLDHILDQYVGGCGKYQFVKTLLLALCYYMSLGILFITVFTAYAPDHRCKISGCDLANQTKASLYSLTP